MENRVQDEIKKQRRLLEHLLEDTIVDSNIRSFIFGTDDIDELLEDLLSQYRLYPVFMKNALLLTFYFSYACYRYDMDFGGMFSQKMGKHNAKRVIKSLKDVFVRYPATQELIQYVLTDIQFDLAQNGGELKDVFGDLSNRDMSRFSFNPYFKLISAYDKNPSRYQCENKAESLRMLKELLETLTFLHNYELQQLSADMFRFVCTNNSSCDFDVLPLNHIFFRDSNLFGGIYHLFSVELREDIADANQSTQPLIVLKYFSGNNSVVFTLPDDDNNSSHLINQRPNEVYMELTGFEMPFSSQSDKTIKNSNSIDQIHTVNYKYIKNLALAISDAISANAGSKEAIHKHFGAAYPYVFQKSGAQSKQPVYENDIHSLDWDTIVIMLLIEASPTAVLERLMWSVPQTFYDIVSNLYKRTDLPCFNVKQAELNAEVQRIHDTKLVVGEAGGFGKITKPKPTGRLLARARAMLIVSHLSMFQENKQNESLIYTGNLHSNISLLKSMDSSTESEKRIRHACIILSETFKHLMCFYSGLYKYGEIKAEYDNEASNKCLSEDIIADAQKKLEDEFFAAAQGKAEKLAKENYETDHPKGTLRLFDAFISFCDLSNNSNMPNPHNLYVAVGKYEIIDKRVLKKHYMRLLSVSDAPYQHAETWVNTTIEILEYFKTGSYGNTPFDHNLFNTIYPFTAAFNRSKENPDGYKTVNFSLNIDIDNDNKLEYQTNINVLSEFSYPRSEVYYCLPNVIRSNYKWWIDPVLINFRRFNNLFNDSRKEEI